MIVYNIFLSMMATVMLTFLAR